MTNAAPTEISPELIERFNRSARHYDPGEIAPRKETFTSDDYCNALRALRHHPDETVALYVHVPFCPGRCLYCGCNTTVTHKSQQIDHYLATLASEIDLVAREIGGERDVLQLYVAGGTPNYLTDAQLTRLVESIERHFRILPETDTTIECDPRRASAGQLDLLHALGFRRITFGVQDLEPRVQRAIGRIQSIELVRDVYWMAREAGFESIGFDLIYGLPEQTEASFQATLEAVIEMAPDRVAFFSYSRGSHREPHQHAIDIHRLPGDLERQRLFHRAVKAFTGAGYVWIGLETFALDTDELALAQEEGRLHRNCIGYTVTNPDHTLGFGTGAVGEVAGHCIQNETNLKLWQTLLAQGQLPIARGQRLSHAERRRRDAVGYMLCNLELPLRLVTDCFEEEYRRLAGYAADGLVEVHADRLRITDKGRYFLRHLCSEHDAYFAWDRAHWHFTRTP